VAFLASVAAAAPFCFTPVGEGDAGWHLALGRLILARGLPSTNSLAWTEPNQPFYATSWLFDVISYVAVHLGGMLGLQLLTLALTCATLAGVTVACRLTSKTGYWVPITTAWLLVPRITPRPHLASWALLAAVTALCLGSPPERRAPRWIAVALIALGSNLHAGAMFSSIALGVFCGEGVLRERRFWPHAALAAAGFLALCANPGGFYNVWYVLTHLKLYDLIPIQELQSPRLADLPAFWALIIPACGLAFTLRRQRPGLALLPVVFAFAGAFAARLAFKFYIAASPAIAAGTERLPARVSRLLPYALVALAVSTNLGRYMDLELAARWNEHEQPVRAVAFIKAHGLGGRFYNAFGDGGYIAWVMPQLPIFQDARVLAYSPDFFRRQLGVEHQPDRFDALMTSMGVEWAVTSGTPGSLTGAGLLPDQRWALVYWDDISELRVRRDAPLFATLGAEELRILRPDRDAASVVATARTGSPEDVARLQAERERVSQSGGAKELVDLVDCALALRRRDADPPVCATARARWPSLDLK
jgi:hypothetical protein